MKLILDYNSDKIDFDIFFHNNEVMLLNYKALRRMSLHHFLYDLHLFESFNAIEMAPHLKCGHLVQKR
jgi:hypothetical protein